jgi:hypothetical protein
MIKKFKFTMCLLLLGLSTAAQDHIDQASNNFWSRIFLPSIDVGYQFTNSDLIGGAFRIGTSIEYRIRNNNDFFVRLNYDTYGSKYQLDNNNNTTNNIEGTAQFQDIIFGPGYRLGDKTFRIMFSVMAGTKLYEVPVASLNGQQVTIESLSKSIFTTLLLSTAEYYIDEKSALTFSIYQNQVWRKVDFWENGGSAIGFSIGFITSLR